MKTEYGPMAWRMSDGIRTATVICVVKKEKYVEITSLKALGFQQ